jgi:hypothetical protein
MIKIWKPKRSNTKIFAEISNGATCVNLLLWTFPLCPDYYDIQQPRSVNNLKVTGILQPKLELTWPDFKITDKASGTIIQAPTSINIKMITATRLRKIISGTFFLKIRIEHNGTTFMMDKFADAPALPPYQFQDNDHIVLD